MKTIQKSLYRFSTPWAGGIVLLLTGLVNVVEAANAPTNIIPNSNAVVNIFCGALNWMFWLLIVLSIAMVLVGGYTYVTSQGDAEKVSKATKTLVYAAVALFVGIVAKGAPLIIGSFLNVPATQLNACSS